MDRGNSLVSVILVNDDRDLDLRGRDHADVDLSVKQRFKHLRGNTRVAFHTRADNRYLRDIVVVVNACRADIIGKLLTDLFRFLTLVLRYGEGDVLA